MDITEIKKKRDKLEAALFDLVYQFTKETEITPYNIDFNWAENELMGRKHSSRQLIDCIVKIEI